MMKKILTSTLMALLSPIAFSANSPTIAMPQNTDVKPAVPTISNDIQTHQPEININPSNDDLLRKERMDDKRGNQNTPISGYTEEALLSRHTAVLENAFVKALIADNNRQEILKLRNLYAKWEGGDPSLIEWADAAILADKDLNKSVRAYRQLIANFPKNDFIRFQMAKNLFYNQEFEASKNQFEKLRSSDEVTKQDIVVFDYFLDAIANKNKWNFSFNTHFLNDKNMGNAAKVGTKLILPNGATLTQNSPHQKGTGLSASFGADKQWSLNNGKYLALDTNLSSKFYWNNHRYNELTAYVGSSFGYADAKFSAEIKPYVSKRWYAGGSSNRDKARLKQYTNTYGLALSTSYWFKPKWKYSANYVYSYEKYDNRVYKHYNGSSHSLGNTLLFLRNPQQYWAFGVDASAKNAKGEDESYRRYGTRLIWGQEWPLGFSTSASVGIAKRHYKKAGFFGVKQKNTEYSAHASIWHKAVHYGGFTPRLTWSYNKTKSNIIFNSYKKGQVSLEVSKTF